ncbi:MAG: hypothetical protein K6U88_15545, partial [Dehalococcoidia bacterium]|nr:hypothetical protein [Dehalococcoidia bacterium]
MIAGAMLESLMSARLCVAKMTLTFAAICLALLLQGVQGALLCAVVGACVGSVARRADAGCRL